MQLERPLGLGHGGILVVQELLLILIPLHSRVVDLQYRAAVQQMLKKRQGRFAGR
jgi:hypothetical protein